MRIENAKELMQYRKRVAAVTVLAGLGLSLAVGAQPLSSPMGNQPMTSGQGPGVHGANSAFAPLVPRADLVPWSVLTEVTEVFKKPSIVITFSDKVRQLSGRTIKVQGFMAPLEAGTSHRHFLLLSVPPTCQFCVPGGAESMIEVRTVAPLKYSQNVFVVEGRFELMKNDPRGLYYRMTGARQIK